jgi:protein-tyrosine phosphatase
VGATVHRSIVHDVVGGLRRTARVALARVRLAFMRNPPMPASVRSMMFVCKGNICRSPYAALRAERLVRELGLGPIRCFSSGLKPSQADASPPDAIAAAAARGYDLRTWRPLPLTDAAMGDADLVVVMETAHLDQVRERWPAYRDKTVLLPLFDDEPGLDAWARLNIADPFDKGPEAFERCYARLDTALRALCARLPVSTGNGPGSGVAGR